MTIRDSSAESHLMRRSPRQGRGPGDVVVYTLEDLAAPAGSDPKAVIEVHRSGDVATVVGGGVPVRHRGHGYGPRLARQVTTAVRAEGCRLARIPDPGTDEGRRMLVRLPEETTTSIALLRLPPLPELPEPLRGRFVVHLRFAHLGPAEEGAALLAPMRAVAPAVMDLVADMPYAAVDSVHMDPVDPMPVWERGATLRDLPAEAVDALLAAAGPGVEVPLLMVELRHLGGAVARPARAPNAVAGRGAAFTLFALGPTAGPLAETMPALTQAVVDRMAPWAARGALLNFLGSAGPERVRRLWDDADLGRLLAVKRRLDPGGLFCTGHALGR